MSRSLPHFVRYSPVSRRGCPGTKVVVSDGFAEIMPDYVILPGIQRRAARENVRKRAERARERAEERLRQKQSIREYHLSKAALARAMARLKATADLSPNACPGVIIWNIGAGAFSIKTGRG